jgi:hypothetical protein
MPNLENPTSPAEFLPPSPKNLNKKEKMPAKEEKLSTEQQLQELLDFKQKEEAEKNKQKKREYTFYYWATPIISAVNC